MTFKYFSLTKESKIDDVKKQYKKMAFKLHPDVGGSTEEMQELNNEYEKALKFIGDNNNKNYSVDMDFIQIIEDLIQMGMDNVQIEICGWFIYVSGNTKPYKNKLSEKKLIWNSKKIAWYWKPPWYVKRGGDTWDMSKIRETWGSQIVNNNQRHTEQPSLT